MSVPSAIISDIDVLIASRIKLARRDCALSQTALGEAVGVTFQQIQKYERPSNRVSAATLFRMAQVLGRPIQWFFESPAAGDTPASPDRTATAQPRLA